MYVGVSALPNYFHENVNDPLRLAPKENVNTDPERTPQNAALMGSTYLLKISSNFS